MNKISSLLCAVIVFGFKCVGIAQTYIYDLNGRLTSAAYAGENKASYSYDSAGNIFGIFSSANQSGVSLYVDFLSPNTGTTCAASSFVLSGSTTDTNQVLFVFYKVNGGAFQLAITTNSWTNWSASANLVLGTNIIAVYAQDATGNFASNQLNINYVLPTLWTPIQLSTNLSLWLDAMNSNSITLNGNLVTQWNDLSGFGNSVTNSSSSSQPTFISASGTNLAYLAFDGGNLLSSSYTTLAAGTAPLTFYAVASIASGATGWRYVFSYGTANTSNSRGCIEYGGTQLAEVSCWGSDLILNSNWTVIPGMVGAVYSNATILGNFDGGPFSSENTTFNTTTNTSLNIGCNPNKGEYWSGKIYEIVAANSLLGKSQMQTIEGYLAWKWGFQTSLPSNHPYRYFAPANPTPPVLTANALPGQVVNLQLTGIPGYPYILESATSLAPPVSWSPMVTNYAGTNGNWTFTDTNTGANSARFYRVVAYSP